MSKRKTHEEFVEEFYENNPNAENIILHDKYINSLTKISCECKLCGHIWDTKPQSLTKGHGCEKCSCEKRGRARLKTHNEFVNELSIINPNIEVLGQYKNIKTHINCKCKICNHEWNGIPNNLIRGTKCPNCAREKKRLLKLKTHEQFVEEMKIVNPNIEILGEYIHSKEKIKCKCKICNNVWGVIPNALLIGHGCPICANKSTGAKARKSQEQFIADMAITHPELEVLGEYKGNKIKITCRCKECGNIFDMTPNSLLGGQGCPPCSRQRGYDKTKLTNEEFLSRLELLKPTYKVIDKYITCETKV